MNQAIDGTLRERLRAVADATRVAGFPSGNVLQHLRDASDANRSGALTDDEFTALKRRLLGP
jgi:hypothetical protein